MMQKITPWLILLILLALLGLVAHALEMTRDIFGNRDGSYLVIAICICWLLIIVSLFLWKKSNGRISAILALLSTAIFFAFWGWFILPSQVMHRAWSAVLDSERSISNFEEEQRHPRLEESRDPWPYGDGDVDTVDPWPPEKANEYRRLLRLELRERNAAYETAVARNQFQNGLTESWISWALSAALLFFLVLVVRRDEFI